MPRIKQETKLCSTKGGTTEKDSWQIPHKETPKTAFQRSNDHNSRQGEKEAQHEPQGPSQCLELNQGTERFSDNRGITDNEKGSKHIVQ